MDFDGHFAARSINAFVEHLPLALNRITRNTPHFRRTPEQEMESAQKKEADLLFHSKFYSSFVPLIPFEFQMPLSIRGDKSVHNKISKWSACEH